MKAEEIREDKAALLDTFQVNNLEHVTKRAELSVQVNICSALLEIAAQLAEVKEMLNKITVIQMEEVEEQERRTCRSRS